MNGKQPAELGTSQDDETFLSYFLKTIPYGSIPTDAQTQSLHLYASSPDDPTTRLRDIIKASEVLNTTLHGYASTSVSEHKLVSILRQSTALINSLHIVSTYSIIFYLHGTDTLSYLLV